jgi:DNA segregation ATPase FtsK/SpoIIIE-like protein
MRESSPVSQAANLPYERKCEIAGVVLLLLTTLLFGALVTDGFSTAEYDTRPLDGMLAIPNMLGVPGAAIAGGLALFVGDAAHVVYGLTFIWALMLISHRHLDRLITRLFGMLILTGAFAAMLQIDLDTGLSNPMAGGAFGAFLADSFLLPHFGVIGSNLIAVHMALIGVLLATDFLLIHVVIFLQRAFTHLIRGNLALYDGFRAFYENNLSGLRDLIAARVTARANTWDKEDADEEVTRRALQRRKKKGASTATTSAERAALLEEEVPETQDRDHLDRINIHQPGQVKEPVNAELPLDVPTPNAETDDLPFEDVPEETAADASPREEAPDAPDTTDARYFFAESPPEAPQEDREELAAAVGAETDRPAGNGKKTDNVQPVDFSNAATRPKARRPRRKNVAMEELPEDYEYPKRYTKPAIDLLEEGDNTIIPNLAEQLRGTSRLLEETLETFGIQARVTDVTRGPTITRFELEPAPGIKVSRFLALADDIALALKAHRIRVEAPIPGKGRVGIEAPNRDRDSVMLRELLESKAFLRAKGALPLALGKDITGDAKVADLATMPHLLVAGATGAGKTVCVKALLASLLFNYSPDELHLMMIDPKMVELSIFNDIPHLITPVVTDPKKASTALSWLINEMEERYRLFADLRTRNIEVYNESVDNGEIELEDEDGDGEHAMHVVRKLPYIVCVVDELADLMMLARSEVEDAIARLAQLARAVGIHLIIATQRPSVDVLTGVIKANFPARISFQVSSRVDSRCILDEIGAERLIGMGDMLYLPAGQSKPLRIQGAFVSDDEMNSLVAYLKTQAPPQYKDEIENFGKSKDKLQELAEEDDPLFDEAVQVVLETGQASISMVQRRLRVGYTRAARLIDMMELRGIVGPHTGSKAREILVDAPQGGN